jgi:hypothetical protein
VSQAHFRIKAKFDSAGGDQEGVVTIDRASGLIHARPLRGKAYTLKLSDVANMICQRIILNDLREAKAVKKAARRKHG